MTRWLLERGDAPLDHRTQLAHFLDAFATVGEHVDGGHLERVDDAAQLLQCAGPVVFQVERHEAAEEIVVGALIDGYQAEQLVQRRVVAAFLQALAQVAVGEKGGEGEPNDPAPAPWTMLTVALVTVSQTRAASPIPRFSGRRRRDSNPRWPLPERG